MSGFTFDSLELNDYAGDANGRIVLDLVVGFHGGLVVRGKDSIVPSRVGRYARGRELDLRSLGAHGYVLGTSEAGYLALMDGLEAVLDPTAAPVDLVVTGPYLGLGPGVTRTIQARFLNFLLTPIVFPWAAEIDVSWEAVDPPTWVEAAS